VKSIGLTLSLAWGVLTVLALVSGENFIAGFVLCPPPFIAMVPPSLSLVPIALLAFSAPIDFAPQGFLVFNWLKSSEFLFFAVFSTPFSQCAYFSALGALSR